MKTLSIMVFIIFIIFQKCLNEQLGGVLSMSMLSHLWPYYISGYFIKNEISNRNITSNGIIYGLLVILVLLYLIIYNIYNFDHSSLVAPIIVILLYLYFKDNAKDNRINTLLIYFGRNSLHIYVWHYFLVSSIDLHSIGYWINESNNYIIGFCIYLFFAVIISYCCICFGKFIYQNRLLSLILYGLNIKK